MFSLHEPARSRKVLQGTFKINKFPGGERVTSSLARPPHLQETSRQATWKI